LPQLVLHLFGSPRIEMGGAPIEVDTRKATALLAYLTVTRETHQRDTLAALLWPDYDQSNARAALRRTLSTLNKALGGEHLEITRESLSMAPNADIWLDVAEFRRLLAETSAHAHSQNEVCSICLANLESAANLYHNPFMAGFNLRDSATFEEWQFFQEETLRRELASALEKLSRGFDAAGKVDTALQFARRWLALDPLLEEAHRQLMSLFAADGQRNAALRQYRECVRILDLELGVAPLEETTLLYQAILNREPLPDTGSRMRYIEGTPARAHVIQTAQEQASLAELIKQENVQSSGKNTSLLVGRDAERQILSETYHSLQNIGAFISLEGEAGIGKTRLADELISLAKARGGRVIQTRCYSGEQGLAYAPFVQALHQALDTVQENPQAAQKLKSLPAAILAETARLLPEIQRLVKDLPGRTETGEGAQTRFFEALRQVLLIMLEGPAPGILFLDDLHWADTASLDLLNYLARRLSGTNLLIVTAWRNEPTETVRSLERLAGELKRAGLAVRVHLTRFGVVEIDQMVRSTVPEWENHEALGKRLHQESEGIPFVAVEYLAALTQRSAERPGYGENWDVPSSVRELLFSRLAGLDATALQLLSTASVIGRSFDFHLLREVSGRSEWETVEGLEQLVQAGIVSEQPVKTAQEEIQYDFTHNKLRALIYEETSLARRRLLHRRTAETLARRLAAGQEGRSYGQRTSLAAYHFQQAGMQSQAAEYHFAAGEHARRVFANAEAMAHFQAALHSGHPDQAGLHEAIGDLQTLRGEYPAAIHSYQTAAALCSPGCLANLEHKLGNVHQRVGAWDMAESHYQASLEALSSGAELHAPDCSFQVHLFADRSMSAYARGDLPSAQGLAEQALALATTCADPHALAQANNMMGILARAQGQLERAIGYLEESLNTAEALDDPTAQIAALNNLALVYSEHAHQSLQSLERAITLASQALDLCSRYGDRHRQAALHNNLADLLHKSGREEEAMVELKQAVTIFAEIGHQPEDTIFGNAPAEVWKLTEW
jgi:DNA-binding SARP family transcriptional activator